MIQCYCLSCVSPCRRIPAVQIVISKFLSLKYSLPAAFCCSDVGFILQGLCSACFTRLFLLCSLLHLFLAHRLFPLSHASETLCIYSTRHFLLLKKHRLCVDKNPKLSGSVFRITSPCFCSASCCCLLLQ